MKALITEEFHPVLKENLQRLGYEIVEDIQIDYDGACRMISDYDLLIVNSKIKIDENLLSQAKKLKIVGRIGSGMDIFDMNACERYGVKVLTSPEGNANAVAEHIIGFLLSAMNNLSKSQAEILNGQWIREENRGEELTGKTLAILGFGHNGRQLAKLLSGFDLDILYYDIRVIDSPWNHVRQTSLDELFERADILSIHLPLTPDTENYITINFLKKFKKPIYLVNASRGKICPIATVVEGLRSGWIHKAMLDVFENEPLIATEAIRMLCAQYRLFLTPHIAGWTVESKYRLANILAQKIENELF